MEQTLYGDILFLVNFTMDFLTLFVTAAILRRRVKPFRFTLSSVLGAVYGVASCFMGGSVIYLIAVNLAVSVLMCYIAFERRILPCCALFYGTGCLLGGMMTALYSFIGGISGAPTVFVDGSYRTLSGEIPLGWMAVVAACTGIAAIAGGQMASKRRRARECLVSVESDVGTVTLDGIADSGNLLTDPLSGRAVIIVRKTDFLKILPPGLTVFFENEDVSALPKLSPSLAACVRLIPSSSVGGRKLLLGYLPRSVRIDGVEKSAVLAMGGEESYDGRTALVPDTLCN